MRSQTPRTRTQSPQGWIRLLGGLLLVMTAVVVWQLQVLPLAWQGLRLQTASESRRPTALPLSDYQVAIEAKPITGIADNTSGLTYHPASGNLFAAINRPPAVAEISTSGELIRLMPLDGVRDPEGIAHVQDDLFIIADERENRLHWIRIGPQATRLSVAGAPSLRLAMAPMDNQGIEGVSWDHVGQRLYVSQEIWPRKVWVVEGLATLSQPDFNLSIQEWRPAGGGMVPLGDYSSLTLHEASGHLLVLSKLAGMVLAYAPNGSLAGMLPLWPGFRGLTQRVPQAEGVALDSQGSLYLVSEPNLFYRFDRQQR